MFNFNIAGAVILISLSVCLVLLYLVLHKKGHRRLPCIFGTTAIVAAFIGMILWGEFASSIVNGKILIDQYKLLTIQLQQALSDGKIDETEESVIKDIEEYNMQISYMQTAMNNKDDMITMLVVPKNFRTAKQINLGNYVKHTEEVSYIVLQTVIEIVE